jgi:CRISPR/Cas system CSM-associated protein Csm5 (group 7 of RAMP superfamily)
VRFCHLERLNITLRSLSPVFIGSGERLSKKEYIFDPRKGMIYFPDFPRLVAFLKSRSLLPAYQDYLLQARNNDSRRLKILFSRLPVSLARYLRGGKDLSALSISCLDLFQSPFFRK